MCLCLGVGFVRTGGERDEVAESGDVELEMDELEAFGGGGGGGAVELMLEAILIALFQSERMVWGLNRMRGRRETCSTSRRVSQRATLLILSSLCSPNSLHVQHNESRSTLNHSVAISQYSRLPRTFSCPDPFGPFSLALLALSAGTLAVSDLPHI